MKLLINRIDIDKNCFYSHLLNIFKKIFMSMSLYSRDGTDSEFLAFFISVFKTCFLQLSSDGTGNHFFPC